MKLLQTKITPFINDMMHLEFRQQPFFRSPFHSKPCFHAHPELQLTYIIEGHGKRIVGNTTECFESGDMVFVGSNVPHIWLSDPVYYEEGSALKSTAIIAYFNPKIFLNVFSPLKAFDNIREMIRQASRGIKVTGETKALIAARLMGLSSQNGFEKVAGFLHIMNLLSVSGDKSFIIEDHCDYPEHLLPDKLIEVMNFIRNNFQHSITLQQVADIAGMTKESFCRFFKLRIKKSFSVFVNDLRISRACELLEQTDKPITEIAYLSGYGSSPHFCTKFKEQTGISPLRYKKAITRNNVHRQ